ncbi:unnamed protein product [Cunninghamella blakesleeana]
MYIHSFLFLFIHFIFIIHGLTIPHTTSSSSIIRAPLIKKQIHPSLTKRDKSSTIELYNDNAFIYLIDIGIGKKNTQHFTVGLDTGSSDIWVPNVKCPKAQCQLNTYDAKKSITFEPVNKPFEIEYARGKAEGEYIKETLMIGDIEIQHQQLSIINNLTDIELFPESTIDKSTPSLNGILGLAFPSLMVESEESDTKSSPSTLPPSIMESMMNQHLIQKQLFSIYLNQKDVLGYSGEIVFGGIDHSKYKGDIAYLPVVPIQSHQTKKKEPIFAHWNHQSKTYHFDKRSLFVFDTGTSFTYFPKNIVKQLIRDILPANEVGEAYERIPTAGNAYKIDCQYKSSNKFIQLDLPIPSFMKSNHRLVSIQIPISNLILPVDGQCAFGILPNDDVEFDEFYLSNMHIIGDTILRSLYLVFDMENKQIGLAAAKKADSSVIVV